MSTQTPNIGLTKPSSDENYSVAVWNGNSDTLDTEIALRVKSSDIQNSLTSTATNKPLSAAQGKALNDAKVNVSDIQNNLTSTATNKPLSAAQGKALSDTKADKSEVAALGSKFGSISVPTNSDGIVPVGSTEHAILILTSGWTLAINGYAWVCSGYATGASRKSVNKIGNTGNVVTCTASDTGYIIHNGGNSSVEVSVIYLLND